MTLELLAFQPMNEASVRQIATWVYDAPYDVYAWGTEHLVDIIPFFTDPGNRYFTIAARAAELVSFCCFGADAQVPGGDYSEPALDVGLCVRPDLTGQGRGRLFVGSVLAFARRAYAPARLRVTVASFNQRALRVWNGSGFREQQTFQTRQQDRAYTVLVLDT